MLCLCTTLRQDGLTARLLVVQTSREPDVVVASQKCCEDRRRLPQPRHRSRWPPLQNVVRPLHRPQMKNQLVEIHSVLHQCRRPQDWMTVNVVPHLPGSANSPSASRRREASSSSLRLSSSRDSSATLN